MFGRLGRKMFIDRADSEHMMISVAICGGDFRSRKVMDAFVMQLQPAFPK